ncbi:SHOCT domain-containing protein [Streptomyces sp. NPDC058718]|uniref:SHOCT domain-containing protein n=1 Tax=Streptomyces sp. NPDC058718 TaxID=3346610 RepID=UPI0036AC3628
MGSAECVTPLRALRAGPGGGHRRLPGPTATAAGGRTPPPPAQSPLPPAAAPASGPAPTVTDQLTRLGELAQQGLLTPEEFAAAKAKLLGV